MQLYWNKKQLLIIKEKKRTVGVEKYLMILNDSSSFTVVLPESQRAATGSCYVLSNSAGSALSLQLTHRSALVGAFRFFFLLFMFVDLVSHRLDCVCEMAKVLCVLSRGLGRGLLKPLSQ